MRPRRLKMRGFITYKEEIDIDFTTLFDKKIFLISGATGSGKTSIFDAINFALYGKVARDISADRLRCDFLSEEDPYTYVSLDFEVGDRTYRIERIPRQVAKKTKIGQNIGNAVSLYDITDDLTLLSEKKTETDEMIKNIIGLDDKQFSKVMLLAQGKFQEFLSAKSTDKAKLLGDIFKTYEYKNFQDQIKDMAKDSIQKMEYIDNDLENIISYNEEISSLVDRDFIITHDFPEMEKVIKEKKLEYENKSDLLKESESTIDKAIKSDLGELQKAEIDNTNIEKFKEIEKNLKEERKKESEYEKLRDLIRKSELANNISIFEKNYQAALTDIDKNKANLEILKKDEKSALKTKEEVRGKYEKLAEDRLKLDKLKRKVEDIENTILSLDKFKEAEIAYKSIEERTKLLDQTQKERESLEKDLEKEREIFDLNNELLGEITEKGRSESKNLSNISENIRKEEEDLKKLREIKGYEESLLSLSKEKDKLEASELKAKENEDLLIINKLIDRTNEEGICPVCGSKHVETIGKHPIEDYDLDKLRRELISSKEAIKLRQGQVEKIRKEISSDKNISEIEKILDGNYKRKEEIEKNIKSLRENYKQKDQARIGFKKKFDKIYHDLEVKKKKEDELKRDAQDNKEIEIAYLSQKDKMKDLSKKSLVDEKKILEKEILDLDKDITEVNRNYQNAELKIKEIQTKIENIKENIKDLDLRRDKYKEEFDKKLEENFDNIASYKEALENYSGLAGKKEGMEEFFNNLEKLMISEENFASYKDMEIRDLDKLRGKIKSKEDERDIIRNQKSEIHTRLDNFTNVIARLKLLRKDYEMNMKENESLARLSKVADGSFGKVKGREKIDFETFVLTYYFDKVLKLANMRLLDMTDNQFSMVRKSDTTDQRSKTGLDIEILDANTGKMRPVSTLSGGESFLASLSLALGLSDEISMENGGVRIDTLFIDEGFGSLSKDYLENAISAIEKLAYEDKFIGLISHVDELKEAIDAKILVFYEPSEGSKVEVEA